MPDRLTRPEGKNEDAQVIVGRMVQMYRRASELDEDEKRRARAKEYLMALELALYALRRVALEDFIRDQKDWIKELEAGLDG